MEEQPPSYDAVLQASQAEYATNAQAPVALATRVTITDPVLQRGAGGAQFTSYKVTTRSSDASFKCCNAGDSVVMRRFSEFHLLYCKLRADFPGVIVAPCPEKNQIEKFRKTAAFIEARRHALEVFINKLCKHRLLRGAELLRKFLEADETAWQMEVQRIRQGEGETSFLGQVTQMASDVAKNLAKAQPDERLEDTEYLQYKEYATHLDNHLKDACSRSADFVAKQAAFGEALHVFGEQAAAVAKYEEGAAAHAFHVLQGATDAIASMHNEAHGHMNRIFAAPMKEQCLAMKSLKDTMQDRADALTAKVHAEANLNAAKAKVASLRAGGKPDAVLTAEGKMNEAEAAAQKAQDDYLLIEQRMKEELVIFQNDRSQDMSRSLRDFALAQAKLAKQSAKQWRSIVDQMKPIVEAALAEQTASLQLHTH